MRAPSGRELLLLQALTVLRTQAQRKLELTVPPTLVVKKWRKLMPPMQSAAVLELQLLLLLQSSSYSFKA